MLLVLKISPRIRVVSGLKKEDKKILMRVQTREMKNIRKRDSQCVHITDSKEDKDRKRE